MEDFYRYWINNIKGIGNIKIARLLDIFEIAENIYKSDISIINKVRVEAGLSENDIYNLEQSKKDTSIYEEYQKIKSMGVGFTYPGKDDYPNKLLNIYDYPQVIYYKGKLPDSDIPTVAIVGARNCSEYGKKVAYEFSKSFAKMGISVISGMAVGVDTHAHKGAIDGGGYTCAALGCGVDVCYPRGNINIYMDMCEAGGIISEYPIGTPPLSGQFPARNRIISGLSDVVIVVEARRKSGSLITADQALEQNREIMVVPGRINDGLSEGCNELIKLGASIITKPEDIFSIDMVKKTLDCTNKRKIELENKGNNKESIDFTDFDDIFLDTNKQTNIKNNSKTNQLFVASEKNIVYGNINLCPISFNELMENCNLTFDVLSQILLELQLDGYIEEVSKNYYVRTHL